MTTSVVTDTTEKKMQEFRIQGALKYFLINKSNIKKEKKKAEQQTLKIKIKFN